MEIIPAIDIKDGACVRLYQGDFSRETVFSLDPAATALDWQRAGAARIHVVDLDGSRTGSLANLATVRAVAAAVAVPVQVGGGVRSLDDAQRLFDAGADRVVLGTVAVEDPAMLEELCRRWGADRVVVAVDARDGGVAIKGWQEATAFGAVELVEAMALRGAERFLYTDISRDGTLTSPNFEAVAEMVRRTGRKIIASGGVSSVADVRRLATTGAESVVIGSALYRGAVDLGECIAAGRD